MVLFLFLPGMVMMQKLLFVLLLCCGLLFENYIVDASIFWELHGCVVS